MTCEKCGNPTTGDTRCTGCRRLFRDVAADRTTLAIGAVLVIAVCLAWDYLVAVVLAGPPS